MSSQVVRLTTGDVIQVRTGVIQGIGPQGPVGPTGAKGDTGDQGPQGPQGPAGSILAYSTFASGVTQALANTTVTSNELTAYATAAFANVDHDDLSAVKSTTNFDFTAGADYQVNATVKFIKQTSTNGSGSRSVRAVYASQVVAEATVPASVLVNTTVNLSFVIRCVDGSAVLNITVAQNDTASISFTPQIQIAQVGPGPAGPQGDPGIQGSVGAVGPQGPVGPAGSVANNTTTFATLGGDNL